MATRFKIIALIAAGAFISASAARAQDTVLTYNFAPNTFAWVSNPAPHTLDGGYLSGSFTFDWTTGIASNVSITSSAPTSGTPATKIYTTATQQGSTSTYNGTAFTYDGIFYATGTLYDEITMTSGGVTTYVDFTRLSTSDPFPGQIPGIHSSSYGDKRILAETVIASGGTVFAPEPASLALLAAGIAGLGLLRRRKA